MKEKYYRVYRPFDVKTEEIEPYQYLFSEEFCNDREDAVRYFQIIQEDMKRLFEYVELSKDNGAVFSLQINKLLITTCTEVENQLKAILKYNGYTSETPWSKEFDYWNMKKDYYQLNKVLHLNEYHVKLLYKNNIGELIPFEQWDSDYYKPLQWYQSYNNVKHNRSESYKDANLINLLNAFAGLYVLLYAQFYQFANVVSITNSEMIFVEPEGLIVPNMKNILTISKEPNWKLEEKYEISGYGFKRIFD